MFSKTDLKRSIADSINNKDTITQIAVTNLRSITGIDRMLGNLQPSLSTVPTTWLFY